MLITNFSSGELSNKLNGRVDIQQYFQGAQKINNFDIIPTGGIKRRTGLKRMGQLHNNCRLIPFIIDKDTSFIFEVIEGIVYVWKNGQKLMGVDDQQISFEVPYNSIVHIKELQYAQNYNELVIVHKNYDPFLIRYNIDQTNFTTGPMAFDFYPEVNLDDDFDYIIIDPLQPIVDVIDDIEYVNDIPYYSGVYWLNDSKLHKYNKDRGIFEVISVDPEIDTTLFTSEGKRPGAVAFFNNRLFFAGTKQDPQKIWASCTPDTEGNRYNKFATYKKFITVDKILKDEDMHIMTGSVKVEDVDPVAGTTVIRNLTQDLTGRLIKDLNEYYVAANIIPVGTKIVSLTADTLVIDKALTITEDVDALTVTVQLWRSHDSTSTEDFEYKIIDNNAVTSDSSFNFELGSSENDAIQWLASNRALTIGTESTIWDVPANVTALNIGVIMNGRYGSDNMQALSIEQAVVFIGQGKMSIREHYYQAQNEAFQTSNLAILADHILTESPAVDFDYSINPYSKLHIVRKDGTAVQLLYDKTNGVMAWSHFTHACGALRSCSVVRGDRQNDLIYYAVEIGDSTYLERYDDNDNVYLDSWSEYSEETAGDYTEDAVTYEKDGKVYIGYKFTSDIISLPVVANDPTGKKRITNLLVRFLESYFPTLKIEYQEDEVFSGEQPYSGIKNITFPGISDRDVRFMLSTDNTEAVTILAINAIIV